MRPFKPTPALVVALLALIFAMAGTGLAAKSYVISSSSQIKDGAITGQDLKKATITGTNVKDKSLTRDDFSGSVAGPAGPQGPKGENGAKGDKGDTGQTGPRGPSSALYGSAPAKDLKDSCLTCVVGLANLLSTPPPGPYVLTAKAWLENQGATSQTVGCQLVGHDMEDDTEVTLAPGESAPVNLLGVIPSVPDGYGAVMTCDVTSDHVIAHDSRLVATEVASLN